MPKGACPLLFLVLCLLALSLPCAGTCLIHVCSNYCLLPRRRWALKCLAVRKNEILGVQSLRNSMFAATLIASSVLTVGFSLLQSIVNYVRLCIDLCDARL